MLKDAINSQDLEIHFAELVRVWRKETGMLSSVTKKFKHPAYQEILALGPKVVPLILKELRDRPDHWFSALKALTGGSPVILGDRTSFRQVREAWLKWGEENDYLQRQQDL